MEYRNKDAHESTLDIIDNLIKSGRKIMEEKTNIYGTIVVHCESGKVLSVIKNDSSDQMDVEKELLKKIELVDERILYSIFFYRDFDEQLYFYDIPSLSFMIGLVELNKLNATTYFVFPREERYFVKPIFNMIKQEYYEVSNYFEYKITDTMRKIIRYIEDKAEIILSSNKLANIVYTENNYFYHYSTNDIDDEKQQKEFIDIVDDKSEKILYLASIKMENGKIEYFLNKKIGKRILFLSKGNISTCFLLENNGSYNVLPFKDEYKDEK